MEKKYGLVFYSLKQVLLGSLVKALLGNQLKLDESQDGLNQYKQAVGLLPQA